MVAADNSLPNLQPTNAIAYSIAEAGNHVKRQVYPSPHDRNPQFGCAIPVFRLNFMLGGITMELNGLHILLTYQCNFECDHCFAWGSPWQSGTMTLKQIEQVLQQAVDTETVEWIYFEGGEPFLYYMPLLAGAKQAARLGFKVGLVTNSYWATSVEDAIEWLRPLKDLLQDLSVSSDLYHYDAKISQQVKNAETAAGLLDIPLGIISIDPPENASAPESFGQLPIGESRVMFRGRAVQKLAHLAETHPWESYDRCPEEDLHEPGRIHLDPLGNLHICQGISIGNLFEKPLSEICRSYAPEKHPITGPLLEGGPAELARRYGVAPQPAYADACHLCYQTRTALRQRFSETLLPDQMYGVF